jgi:hypothetical protein
VQKSRILPILRSEDDRSRDDVVSVSISEISIKQLALKASFQYVILSHGISRKAKQSAVPSLIELRHNSL